MDLQPEWTNTATDLMRERGSLIRSSGPEWLRGFAQELAATLGIDVSDLTIHGSDGVTNKTRVPWFRFADERRSPNARSGWYCVYLFSASGHAAYLGLIHAATSGRDFRAMPDSELHAIAARGRSAIAEYLTARKDLVSRIALHDEGEKGAAYEKTTILAKEYRRESLPEEAELRADAVFFAGLLRRIYEAGDSLGESIAPSHAPEEAEPPDPDDLAGLPGLARVDPPEPTPGVRRTRSPQPRDGRSRDYSAEQARRSKVGRAGELTVLRWEYEKLVKAGREDLAQLIRHVGDPEDLGDSAGFDIVSFELDGTQIDIEVKATTKSSVATPFFLSAAERRYMEQFPSQYRLYRLYSFRAGSATVPYFVYTAEDLRVIDSEPSEYIYRPGFAASSD